MNLWLPCTVLVSLALPILAQNKAPEKKPRRSLAEGLVRQIIESERLQPPRLESGLEMAAGQGPLALLVRKRDGSLTIRPLQRGVGDHGAAAKPPDATIQEEEEEIVEEEKKKPPTKGKGAGNKEKPRPPRARPAKSTKPAQLRLRQYGEVFRILTGDGKPLLEGSPPDRAKLAAILKSAFATTAKGSNAGTLFLDSNGDVRMQDLLSTWEIARSVGFRAVGLFGTRSKPSDEDRATLRSSLQKLAWKRKGPLSEGELLILLDGQSRWKDIGPLVQESARAGVWQLAFVGQRDRKMRFKIPVHLPVDRGL